MFSYNSATSAMAPSVNLFCSQSVSTVAQKAIILLVEDNPLLQYLHKNWLEQLGYEVTVAGSGEEALEQLNNYFDVIFMDIDLPGANGVATTHALFQKHPRLKAAVIACSSHAESEMKADCFSAGMVDYLQKPISLSKLDATLKFHLAQGARHEG